LKIVSNDPALEREQLPQGVSWIRGRNRDQVRDLLHTSDLFVFPTRQDYMPQVIAEALTTGVPCIASDVGAVRDLVQTNRTGFLMPYDASLEAWAQTIRSLRDQPERLEQLSRTSREFAEQHLDRTIFEDLIRSTIVDLQNLRQTKSTS
jgi:glycosyltransferase involved in cell wall biosynthesis